MLGFGRRGNQRRYWRPLVGGEFDFETQSGGQAYVDDIAVEPLAAGQ